MTPDGSPGLALFMTPLLMADGSFSGTDSLALAGAPFESHTGARGTWAATGPRTITADYIFMVPSPAGPGYVAGARFRWFAEATSRNRMVGYVNIFIDPQIRQSWENLGENDFPELPAAGRALVEVPEKFFTDPADPDCLAVGCVIAKFTIRRIQAPKALPRSAKRR